jgi:CheY-like chemotaxis protein
MSRILLADDSTHAQRIGECILREEGYEVVSVTDGATAMVRIADVDPDVIIADVLLPTVSGYQICRQVKENPALRHIQVILTAGALEPLDEEEARRSQADACIWRPFEATVLLQAVKPLVDAAQRIREITVAEAPAHAAAPEAVPEPLPEAVPESHPEPLQEIDQPEAAVQEPSFDRELVRAAVTVALDAAFPAMVEEITSRVMDSLKQ